MSEIKPSEIQPKLFGDFDGDGDRDLFDIYNYIVYYVEKADKMYFTEGVDKKKKVMKDIQLLLPKESFERYKPMISKAIDFVVLLSKKPEIVKNINKKMKECGLFRCCN